MQKTINRIPVGVWSVLYQMAGWRIIGGGSTTTALLVWVCGVLDHLTRGVR